MKFLMSLTSFGMVGNVGECVKAGGLEFECRLRNFGVVDRASRKSWQAYRPQFLKPLKATAFQTSTTSEFLAVDIGLVLKVLTSFAVFVKEKLS